MKLLRRLPKILKFIPGKAQDLRAWFLTMQYWLGGSDDNVEQMVRFLVGSYASDRAFKGTKAAAPIDYPEVGLYHPDLPGHRIVTDVKALPQPLNPVATVGLLMMRSYVLASDTAHYDGVIRRMQAAGVARHSGLCRRSGQPPGDCRVFCGWQDRRAGVLDRLQSDRWSGL